MPEISNLQNVTSQHGIPFRQNYRKGQTFQKKSMKKENQKRKGKYRNPFVSRARGATLYKHRTKTLRNYMSISIRKPLETNKKKSNLNMASKL